MTPIIVVHGFRLQELNYTSTPHLAHCLQQQLARSHQNQHSQAALEWQGGWRPRLRGTFMTKVRCLPWLPPSLFLRKILSLNLEITGFSQAGWQGAAGIHPFLPIPPPQHWHPSAPITWVVHAFTCVLCVEVWSPCLSSKHFTYWATCAKNPEVHCYNDPRNTPGSRVTALPTWPLPLPEFEFRG